MSKYSRNVGETPAQFNARIKVAEAARASEAAARGPKRLNPQKSPQQILRDMRRSEGSAPNDGGSANAPNFGGIIPAPPRSPRGSGTNDGGPNNAPSSVGGVRSPKTPVRVSEPAPLPPEMQPPAPVKKAAGGVGKVRKGMMTSEGTITRAMNKIRGK